MKDSVNKIGKFVVKNKWFFIGLVLVSLVLFSNFFYGYKLSFTNLNYSQAPFGSTATATKGPLLSDIADSHYPSIYHVFYNDEGLSLWDSDIALGREVDTVAFMMNPMEWVNLLPMGLAIFLKAFSEFALGFFAMFLFMRSIGLNKVSSAITGIIYTFSAAIVVWLGWPHSDVAVWAPLLFLAIEKLITTIKVQYMFLIALVTYMMLIVGMPTYAAYFMYLAGIYIVIFTIKHHWKQKKNILIVFAMFAIGVIIGALASLPYTYPVLIKTVFNGYSQSRSSYSTVQLGWEYLKTFIAPYDRTDLPLHINESTLYLGVAAIILLPLMFANTKAKKKNFFFIISSAVIFCLIFTGVFNIIFTKLPLINTSLKFRVIVLLMFTLSAITGITINDIIVNKDYYKKKPWLFILPAVWCAVILYIVGLDIFKATVLKIAIAVIVCVVLITFGKKLRKPAIIVLVAFIAFDSVSFAAEYLPWIDANASVIPQATDSVTYLIENTQNEERVVGTGKWTFFPNTPSYYGLNDIRMHGFEATNSDMRTYYEKISDTVYDTNTRTSFKYIENYNLLKYLGVKYVYGDTKWNKRAIGNDSSNSKVFGVINSYSSISQDIYIEGGGITTFKILMATYGTPPKSNSNMRVSLIDKNTLETVFETDTPVNKINDNDYVDISVDENTYIEKGQYTITLSFGDLMDDTLTVWMKEADDCSVTDGETSVDGAMVLYAVYPLEDLDIVYEGDDTLIISELNEYTDKVELAESVYVYSSEDEVLQAMSEEYIDNTAMLVGDDESLEYNRPLTDNESIEVAEYSDSYVKIICTSEYDRYITLNDYYNENWVAYVNGEKVDIEKANYLTRAVKISAGEDIVIEFKYEPTTYYVVVCFSLAVIVLTAVLFIFKKNLQYAVDKLTAPKLEKHIDDNENDK